MYCNKFILTLSYGLQGLRGVPMPPSIEKPSSGFRDTMTGNYIGEKRTLKLVAW